MADGAALSQQAGLQPLQTGPSQQIHSSMGEVMPLLATFMECLPASFIGSQSTDMLDSASRMPEAAFQKVKVGLDPCLALQSMQPCDQMQCCASLFQKLNMYATMVGLDEPTHHTLIRTR